MIKKSTYKGSTSPCARLNTIIAVFLFAISFAKAQNQLVLIPYSGSTSIPCGQNSLVQAHNGSVGNYSNNANGYVVINAGFAAAITINATYTTEASFDYIRIYNGVGTGGTLLGSYSGQNGTFTYAGTAGQTLTVQFTSDGSVVYAGFNLLVSFNGPCFSTPCAGVPASNAVVGAPLNICPAMNTTLALGTQYQLNGLQYQWYQSTVSNVGPFTPVAASATLTNLVTSPLSTTTWYTAVVTCTNSNLSYTTPVQQVMVMGQTTDVVPYNEGFEGVQIGDMLPNCSWSAANLGNTVRTSLTSQSNNRVPNNGNNFAYFSLPSNNNAMYTNGIYMEPGITYSAGLFYATEYFGGANWSSLSISVGPNQNATGQNLVAATSPAISGPYKELGGYFTVPSAGYYYVEIKANGSSGTALYLMIDDISVTIPCTPQSGNSPTITASASNATICAGEAIALTVTGTDTYTWSNGSNASNTTDTPLQSGTYSVIGTNTLTGCTDTTGLVITVYTSPTVNAVAASPVICPGQVSYLTALGADSYAWSNSNIGGIIQVNPSSTTNYTVIGTLLNGCSNSAVVTVSVLPSPTIIAANAGNGTSCSGDAVTINANGAASYVWYLSSSQAVYFGNPLSVVLTQPTTFTVVGTGANGCTAKYSLNQNVETCTGIAKHYNPNSISMSPNPARESVTVSSTAEKINSIEVFDVSGRSVLRTAVNESSATIDVRSFSSGVYYVKLQTQEKSFIAKLVVQ